MRRELNLGIISILVILFFGSLFIDISPPRPIYSIISSNLNGDIEVDLLTTDGIVKVNRKIPPGAFNYREFLLVDFEGNGELTLIALLFNVRIVAFSYPDLKEKWSYDLPEYAATLRATLKSLDIDGDGIQEILLYEINRVVTTEQVIYVFNKDGELVQSLDPVVRFPFAIGPDQILVKNVDNDPQDEIFILYGAVTWDTNTSTAEHYLFRYDSNGTAYTQTWNNSLVEGGGDTQIIYAKYQDEQYLLSVGWYNNFLKVYTIDGTLLWKTQLSENSPTREEIGDYADSRLMYNIIDGIPVVSAYESTYSAKHDISVKSFNLQTGELLNPILSFSDTYSISPLDNIGDRNLVVATLNTTEGTKSYIKYHNIKDGLITDADDIPPITDNFKYWSGLINGPTPFTYMSGSDQILYYDREYYNVPELPLSELVVLRIFPATSETIPESSQYSIQYQTDNLFLQILILVGISYMIVRELLPHLEDFRFNSRLQKAWPVNILSELRSYRRKRNPEPIDIENLSEDVTTAIQTVQHDAIVIADQRIVDLIEDMDISTWSSFSNSLSLKVKLADIHILAKLANSDRESLSRPELKDLLHISSTSFYYRINQLIKWNLIKTVMVTGELGNVGEELMLTDKGKNLLLFLLSILEIKLG